MRESKFSLTSSNSSFKECARTYSFHYLVPKTLSSNDIVNYECPRYSADGKCLYGPNTVVVSSGGNYLFMDSEFVQCSNSGSGGAIDQDNGHLTITRCLFDRCSCTVRGGAVSFRTSGNCIQEDNSFICCSAGASGALDSFHENARPVHTQRRCKYLCTRATYFGHGSIEYSPNTLIDSNSYVHGRSRANGDLWAGTVVNFHEQGPIVYTNCLFSDGKADNSGGLSFLGVNTINSATLTVKFCFFHSNYDSNRKPREIYFDGDTSSRANKDLIIHSFSATPGSTVFIQNKSPQDQDWLPQGTFLFIVEAGRSLS